jgi:hypothetical protein
MPMLGDVLAAARRSSGGVERWLAADHPPLLAAVSAAAAQEGASVSGFTRIAVADFGRDAAEEDWATLTSRLRDSADPGAACLRAILEWRLRAARAPARLSEGS